MLKFSDYKSVVKGDNYFSQSKTQKVGKSIPITLS